MTNRARNTGSVEKRGKNSWRLRYWTPSGLNGRRYQQSEIVKGTKRDAERVLRERLSAIDRGIPISTGKQTVSQYLEIWLSDVVSVRNTPRTLADYSTMVRRHIIPKLGSIQITKLQVADVESMEAGLMKGGLTANTVRHVHVVLSRALRDAMRRGLVHRNVCQLVEPPQIGRYEVHPPTMETIKKILEAAGESPYYPVYHTIAYTGMRRGEVLALKWVNTDFENHVISVVETSQRVKGEGVIFLPTKSAAARRGVSIDDVTVQVLSRHRAEQAEHRLKLGPLYHDINLVFAGPLGLPMDGSSVTRDFSRILEKNNLPRMRLHDFRHAHASDLIRENVHPRVVQDRLGHASAAFTMQVYGHVNAGLQKEAAEAYSKAMESF